MKAFLPFLFLLLINKAFTQERKSEKATEHIDFSKSDARRTWVKEYVNARTTYYGAQNENMPVTMRLVVKKTPLKNITPFLSCLLYTSDAADE